MRFPVRLQFHESMTGFIKPGERDCKRGFHAGQAQGTSLRMDLTVSVDDLDYFIADPAHRMSVSEGYVTCDLFGGRRVVETGTCNILVDTEDPLLKRMSYRVRFSDDAGRSLTLSGVKDLKDDPGFDLWRDTTTLSTHVFDGHAAEETDGVTIAAGILHVSPTAFVKLLWSIRTDGRSLAQRLGGLARYARFFLRRLWQVYGLKRSRKGKRRATKRTIARHTLEGVKGAKVSTHYVTTEDGLGLSLLRFQRRECDDVVLLVHGLTSSSDMFIMPEHTNLVSYLLDNGFEDVWCFDNRTSNRFPYNLHRHRYTMDDVALYDYPPAIAKIRHEIGNRRLHVICHCVGSLTFMMSLFGKAVKQQDITSVVSNSVALTPRIPAWARVKVAVAPFLVEYVLSLPYADPGASEDPGLAPGEILSRVVSLLHRECDVRACHMLSMMWGSGRPALYNHRNLEETTHERVRDLFGGTSVHYYRHIRAMLRAGSVAVKFDPGDRKYEALPDNYLEYAREIETPVLFMTGNENRVFTDSNDLCYRLLSAMVPNRHELAVIPGYGHQDVFMGKRSHVDVFPRILEFLKSKRTPRAAKAAAA